MAENLIKALEPIRNKRDHYEARPKLVDDIITNGCNRARKVAKQTMKKVRSSIKI